MPKAVQCFWRKAKRAGVFAIGIAERRARLEERKLCLILIVTLIVAAMTVLYGFKAAE